MTVKERGFARVSGDVKATIWAATHRLGQMRRLLMHEKHKAWKREFGFGRIETAAEMDEKRSRPSTSRVPNPFLYRNMVIPRRPHTSNEFTLEMKVDVEGLRMEIILLQPASSSVIYRRDAPRSPFQDGNHSLATRVVKCDLSPRRAVVPVPNPFFYRNMGIPRRPHTPDEFTLEMKVDVEGLRMEIILSKPASSQCDLSPRRAVVDTGSEEPGTSLHPPAIGTRSEESGASRALFETSMNGFLHSNFTSTEQEFALLRQQDFGVDDDEKETTTTSKQAAVREEFVSPTEKRKQRGTTAWATEQHKLFYRGRSL